MTVKSIDHMGLVVEDLDLTRRFYHDFLGLTEIPRPANFEFRGAWFETSGGDQVHVILASDTTSDSGIPEPGASKSGGLSTHWAFVVDDLDAYMAKAETMGYEKVGGPYNRGLGATQVYIQDPDGYQVELMVRTNVQDSDQIRVATNQ